MAEPSAIDRFVSSPRRVSGPRPMRFTLEVRRQMPAWRQGLVLTTSVLCGLAVSTLILILAGVPASELSGELGAIFLDRQSLSAVFSQAAPLILVGVAASIAFQAKFWNLGLEGQMVFGAIGATAITLWRIGPELLRLPLMALAAMLCGVAWVAIPAFLKFRIKVNEIISTLLLNYVATYYLYNLLYGAWKDPSDSFPHSSVYSPAERLPEIGFSLNAALPIAVVAALAIWWLTHSSRMGFYLRFIYANDMMARRVGAPVAAVTFTAVLISGALAGLAGFCISSGMEGRLTQGFYEGYGFSGVLIAFLARNNPLFAGVVAVLVGMLFVTGQSLQIFYQIPFSMVQLIQAVIVMCVAASEFFIRHRIVVQGGTT